MRQVLTPHYLISMMSGNFGRLSYRWIFLCCSNLTSNNFDNICTDSDSLELTYNSIDLTCLGVNHQRIHHY